MKLTLLLLPVLITVLLSGCAGNKNKVQLDVKNPRIVELKYTDVIGISKEGVLSELSFQDVWEEFFDVYDKSSHQDNSIFYGITYTNSRTPADENTKYTYMVGTPTHIYNSLPLEMTIHTIARGEYAVFYHVGPISGIQATFDYIFKEWIPQSMYKSRNGEVFEYYDERFRDERYDSVLEIWVPVTKR